MWLCRCCNVLGCTCAGIIIHLPFIFSPAIISTWAMNVHYGHMSCFMSVLLDGHSSFTYVFMSCVSFSVASHMSSIVVYAGMLFHQWPLCSTACQLFFSSLFSAWFCLDIQLAMDKLGPHLYIMHILYRCILSTRCMHKHSCQKSMMSLGHHVMMSDII